MVGKRRLRGLLLLAFLALAPAASSAAECAGDPALATVILLSWDGVRHDYLDREPLPGLARLAREGARAEALEPVFPSSTFPNHVSLATGTYPDRHGIVGNRFRDPERGEFDYDNDAAWIEAEPLWVAAERQGVRAAVFFWVGSETDWRGVGARYRKTPFDGSVAEEVKVDQILAWLDLPRAERPRLILAWWHGADSAGHRFGPDAPETRRQLAGQDRQLLRLLAGLDARGAWPYTTLLVVSDHGMANVEEAVDPLAPLQARGIRAHAYPSGGVAQLHLEDPSRGEEAVAALGALPGVEAYAAAKLPERLRARHGRRTGDVVALTAPPRFFTRPWSTRDARFRLSRLLGRRQGAHGYDPARHPEMGGIFLALGRGVPAGLRPERPEAVDVAPTVAQLLGIDPPLQAEGAAVRGIGCSASAAPGPQASGASAAPSSASTIPTR